MQTVTSKDGTTIAYDRRGGGPAVILVGGAMSFRKFKTMRRLAEALSQSCTVVNYDRRGRGDSGEATPFSPETAVSREIEDIAALIEAVGGHASLWGWSSGGALALRAAAAEVGVERVGVYEVPFMVDPDERLPSPDYGERLEELVAAGDRSGAVRHFMRDAVGIPAPFVTLMRLMPMWKGLKANAPTLLYDWVDLGAHNMSGSPLDPGEWAPVTAPVQVAYGGKSPSNLRKGSRALAEVLPNAELRELEGQSHNAKVEVVAPLVSEFITRETAPATTA